MPFVYKKASFNGLNTTFKEEHRMNPITAKDGFLLEIQIEELEAKIAPDGGETVLPLRIIYDPGTETFPPVWIKPIPGRP